MCCITVYSPDFDLQTFGEQSPTKQIAIAHNKRDQFDAVILCRKPPDYIRANGHNHDDAVLHGTLKTENYLSATLNCRPQVADVQTSESGSGPSSPADGKPTRKNLAVSNADTITVLSINVASWECHYPSLCLNMAEAPAASAFLLDLERQAGNGVPAEPPQTRRRSDASAAAQGSQRSSEALLKDLLRFTLYRSQDVAQLMNSQSLAFLLSSEESKRTIKGNCDAYRNKLLPSESTSPLTHGTP